MELTPEDLKKLQLALNESFNFMDKEINNEDVIICIGGTRAGKSTLINYLIGNDLKGQKLAKFHPVKCLKVDKLSQGPDIGEGTSSKTTIPTKWISKKLPNLAIWDLPGYEDNRGPIQDITNAFYLFQLIQKVNSLKIVLVVDINDILQDNVKPFLSVLNASETLLGKNMKNCFKSLSVIFTKVPHCIEDDEVDKEFISEKLSYQFLSDNDMHISETSKDLIKFLIQHNDHIAFFKRAKIGPLTDDIDVDIFKTILNSQQVTLKEVSPSVSETSKIYLLKARENLFPDATFTDLEQAVTAVCHRAVSDLQRSIRYSSNTEINKIKSLSDKLKDIQEKFFLILHKKSNFPEKLKILETLDDEIKFQIKKHDLFQKIKLLEFVDKILNMKTSLQLAIKLQTVILSSTSQISEVITNMQFKLGEINQEKYNELMRKEREENTRSMNSLRTEMQKLMEENQERKRKMKTLMQSVIDICH